MRDGLLQLIGGAVDRMALEDRLRSEIDEDEVDCQDTAAATEIAVNHLLDSCDSTQALGVLISGKAGILQLQFVEKALQPCALEQRKVRSGRQLARQKVGYGLTQPSIFAAHGGSEGRDRKRCGRFRLLRSLGGHGSATGNRQSEA